MQEVLFYPIMIMCPSQDLGREENYAYRSIQSVARGVTFPG